MIRHGTTFGVYLREIGISGQLSVFLFLIGIAFAVLIHVRRLGNQHRAAFAAFSLLPFMVGIFGLAVHVIMMIDCLGAFGHWYPAQMLEWFCEILQVLPLATLETTILLFLAALLFMANRSDPSPSSTKPVDAPAPRPRS
jgi:hypothetical protein